MVVDRDPVKAVALWHGHGGWIGRPALVERAGLHRPLVAINAIAPAAMTAVVNHPSRFARPVVPFVAHDGVVIRDVGRILFASQGKSHELAGELAPAGADG